MRSSLSQKPAYIQEGFLGKGSFAEVYKVLINSQPYALKRVYNYQLKNPIYYKCLKRQISIMKKLDHPNIVKLIDVFESQNSLQLLLEYLPGGNLYDKIKCQDRLPQYLVKKYMLDIIQAIKYLHSFPQPILHRDIKPQNILISQNGNVKLCDFGSANMIVPDHARDSYVGTAEYMAPQMKQCKPHDQTLDLWCIGILIYQLLTGCVPDQSQQVIFPDYISRPVEDLIKRILVRQQNKRITIEEIERHIWFTSCQIVPQITHFTLEIKSLNNNLMLEQIRENNNKILDKISKNQQQKQKVQPVLNLSLSMMAKIGQENANVYIKELKQIANLQYQLKKNENVIRKQEKLNDYLQILYEKQGQMIKQKIKQIQEKSNILCQKQGSVQQKCMNSLRDLILGLKKLKQFACQFPKMCEQKVLYFQDIKIESTTQPTCQLLTKMKLKMLQERRDALIQLKCIRKRRKEMELMLESIAKEQYQQQTCCSANGVTEQSFVKYKI